MKTDSEKTKLCAWGLALQNSRAGLTDLLRKLGGGRGGRRLEHRRLTFGGM